MTENKVHNKLVKLWSSPWSLKCIHILFQTSVYAHIKEAHTDCDFHNTFPWQRWTSGERKVDKVWWVHSLSLMFRVLYCLYNVAEPSSVGFVKELSLIVSPFFSLFTSSFLCLPSPLPHLRACCHPSLLSPISSTPYTTHTALTTGMVGAAGKGVVLRLPCLCNPPCFEVTGQG